MTNPPDWDKLGQELRAKAAHISHTLHAQGAMGWMYRGDLEQARRVVRKLPVDSLVQLSFAAQTLSSLADEVAAERGDRPDAEHR